MEEDLTDKEIVIAKKIQKFTDKLINIIDKEKFEFYKIADCKGEINTMCITAVFNTLTTMLACDISNNILDKRILKTLTEDFKIEVDRKLQDFKKEQLEES